MKPNLVPLPFLAITLIGSLVLPLPAADKASESEKPEVTEFRKLIELKPADRSAEQRARAAELWRKDASVRTSFDWFEFLQPGDSLLDFPGLIHDKYLHFDRETGNYHLGTGKLRTHPHPDADTWSDYLVLSDRLIVLRKEEVKVNSR